MRQALFRSNGLSASGAQQLLEALPEEATGFLLLPPGAPEMDDADDKMEVKMLKFKFCLNLIVKRDEKKGKVPGAHELFMQILLRTDHHSTLGSDDPISSKFLQKGIGFEKVHFSLTMLVC